MGTRSGLLCVILLKAVWQQINEDQNTVTRPNLVNCVVCILNNKTKAVPDLFEKLYPEIKCFAVGFNEQHSYF